MPSMLTSILLLTLVSSTHYQIWEVKKTGGNEDVWPPPGQSTPASVNGNVKNNPGSKQSVFLWVQKIVDGKCVWENGGEITKGSSLSFGPIANVKKLRIGGSDYDPANDPQPSGATKKATGSITVNSSP